MKKLSILLTLLLLPLAAAMAEEVEIDDIRYNLDAGTKQATVIQKTVGNDEGDISIPASVDYGGVSYSVTAIGDYAFFCGELTSVYIPNSVTSIGDWAFSNCNSLKAFTVDSANGYYKAISGVLFNKEGTILVSYPKGRTGYSYSIPNGVTTIGDNAFFHCDGLTSIEIPNSVTTIGFQAFVDCRGLTSIEIPNSVTSIGNDAFSCCNGLTSVYIPNSVTTIGRGAFYRCNSLKTFTVDSANDYYKSVLGVLFNKEGTVLVYYPAGKTANSYSIPNSVTAIGESAFANCSDLTSVYIPNSVTTIGYGAFYDCDNLTSVTIETKTPLTIYGGTFTSSADATLYVPAGSKAAYEAADYWKDFKEIVEFLPVGYIFTAEVNGLQMQFRVTDAFKKEVETYGTYEEGPAINNQTEGEVVIPAEVEGYTVTGIGGWSFRNCQGITSVSLPTTLTYIGESAFRTCSSLREVDIPEGVTTIGPRAFYGAGLHKVTLPSTLQEIGGDYTFTLSQDADNIVIVKNPEPIAIPDGAFEWDSMKRSVLIVPLGSREAYQAADYWKEFKAIYDNPVFYSVDVNIGNTVPYSTEGWGNAGDEVTVPYKRYVLGKGFVSPWDKWLFKRDATEKQYNHRFTLSADNHVVNGYPYQTENLEYTFTGIEDVVYLSEAEDIEGMTKCESDHALVRSSNAAAAYPADGDVEFVTLPAGIYQLTAVMYNMHPTDSPYFDSDNPWTFLADGEPIATLTNDIANFDEKTTEPFVLTKKTTLAIKQKGDSQIGLDLIYIRRLQDNELYVDETPSVIAGWKTELNIGLRNVNAVNMTDFYLKLPEGMTIANSAVKIAADRSDKHQVSAQWNATGGYYHILSFSSQNNAFKLNDGTLFNMMIECDESVAAGSYEAKVMTIVMSDTDKTELSQQDFTFTIEVPDLKLGDANADTKVNGLDIVETVDHIMQRPSDTFHAAAVDLYYDKKINGLDLVRLINLVLSQPMSTRAALARRFATMAADAGVSLSVADLIIAAGESQTVAMALANAGHDLTLLEFTLRLPEGVAIAKDEGGEWAVALSADRCADSHTLEVEQLQDGSYKFLVYSIENAVIKGSEGTIINMTLTAQPDAASATAQGQICDQLFVDTSDEGVTPDDVTFNISIEGRLPADANGDGRVSVSDVTAVIAYLSGREPEGFVLANADLDGDGQVTAGDIAAIVSIILGK